MPSLGADMEAGTLVEWYVAPGDPVTRGQVVAEIETQKGNIDIEVWEDGVVERLLVEPGKEVPVGTPLAVVAAQGEEAAATASTKDEAPKVEPAPAPPLARESAPAPAPEGHRIRVSPVARRMAESMGLDLAAIEGTGPGGAIQKRDVEAAASREDAAAPAPEPSPPEPAPAPRPKPPAGANPMRQAIAAAMSRSNRDIPHYYLKTTIDMSRALAWLEELNRERAVKDRILPAALLLRGVVRALKKVPELNGTWTDDALHVSQEVNLGFAVSLRGGGLVTPAILGAQDKSVPELMAAMNELIPRARGGKLRAAEVSSGTITITNLGDRGVEEVFGVIYPPQVALVGFGRIAERPWAANGMLGVHPLVTATLAGDHRATDGRLGARFLEKLDQALQEPEES
jgi:pyruvate dehydrogenase E2 component (dihydrolipoamide acetyltransferase)